MSRQIKLNTPNVIMILLWWDFFSSHSFHPLTLIVYYFHKQKIMTVIWKRPSSVKVAGQALTMIGLIPSTQEPISPKQLVPVSSSRQCAQISCSMVSLFIYEGFRIHQVRSTPQGDDRGSGPWCSQTSAR